MWGFEDRLTPEGTFICSTERGLHFQRSVPSGLILCSALTPPAPAPGVGVGVGICYTEPPSWPGL